MSFRRRIALLAGLAVALAVALASGLAYLSIGHDLRRQVDSSLRDRGALVGTRRGTELLRRLGTGELPGTGSGTDLLQAGDLRGDYGYVQEVAADGTAIPFPGTDQLPVDARTRAVAAGHGRAFLHDVQAHGDHIRAYVLPLTGGGALVIGRSLAETDTLLGHVRWILLAVSGLGIVLAALLGGIVARRAIRPLRTFADAAEHVAATHDLTRRIDIHGDDEIARLTARFNAMLDALAKAMGAQRQLIADASHELRTPITSLRTNIETLRDNPGLALDRRGRILNRAAAQTSELTGLTNDLIDLAHGDSADTHEPVRLDELLAEAIERAQRHDPAREFDVELRETTVVGSPSRLTRALNNLLDNASTWGPPGTVVDVRLADGTIEVRDHGPGFRPDELASVFDRFFRGADARDQSPGFGLGLAIVHQVATSHGGSVEAANAPDGGAIVRLRVPPLRSSTRDRRPPGAAEPVA